MSAALKTRRSAVALDWAGWTLAAALYVVGMALMFRASWLPGPSRSIGDNGDGTILIATLEHWFRVFTGQAAHWLSPGWFWPAKGTLGLTDSYFLIALPYAVARALNVNPFDSYTAAVATLATMVSGAWWRSRAGAACRRPSAGRSRSCSPSAPCLPTSSATGRPTP